jgi:hypothetical protein
MSRRLLQHPGRDMTILGGWLFADLLLGLMVIFLAGIPPIPKPEVPPPPKLAVSAQELSPDSPECNHDITKLGCTMTITETSGSQGLLRWQATSDMNDGADKVSFQAPVQELTPGQSTTVTISSIPCQNGSFVFSGQNGVVPVIVLWHCKSPTEHLSTNYETFSLRISNVDKMMDNDTAVINDIKQQVKRQSILQGRSVGLTVTYGGAFTNADIPRAQAIAGKINTILAAVGKEHFAFTRSSYYDPLYYLGKEFESVRVDVYFFVQGS